MKRKMIGAAAAYMSGLFFASFFNFGSGLITAAVIAAVLLLLSERLNILKADIIMLAVFFTVSLGAASVYEKAVYEKAVAYDGQEGSFCGEILSVSYYDDDKALYTLEGEINEILKTKAVYFGDAFEAKTGDTLDITNCTFSKPEKDYLFDSESYYKSDRIFLKIEKADGVTFISNNKNRLKNTLLEYKEKISSEFLIRAGERNGGLIAGMVFGDKRNMSESEKTAMYRTGIGHIMSVSGLHVSIIAAVVMTILKALRVNRFAAFAVMNVFTIAMTTMAESPFSAIRAAIMINFIYTAGLFRRQNDTLNSLACAVLIICICNPFVIYSSGFLLSVSGTFGIGVFAPYMTRTMKCDTFVQRFSRSVLQMLLVSLCVMPLSIMYFDEISLISPITNVLLIPLCTAVLLIGVLYTATGGLISLLSVAGVISDLVFFVTDRLSRIEETYFSCGGDVLFRISLMCSAFVLITYALFRNRRLTAFAAAGAITVFIFSSALFSNMQKNKFRIAVLGRGENAIAVINYKGMAEAVDLSGHYKSPDYLKKYLYSNGINTLSLLALTEDVQSQFSSYSDTLGFIDTKNLLVCGSYMPDDSALPFTNDGFTAENEKYTLEYAHGILKVEYAGAAVTFVPAADYENTYHGLTVVYGRITKNTEIVSAENVIYLDEADANNFEIEIAGNGRLKVRRL